MTRSRSPSTALMRDPPSGATSNPLATEVSLFQEPGAHMIGFQPSYDEYLVGSKFLTAAPGPHPSDRYKQTLLVNNLHEIIQVDDHIVTTVDREGVESQWRRHWANPLMPTHPTRSRIDRKSPRLNSSH